MDENLVGYLLDALEPDTRLEVEQYVREQPGARQRLELLRNALAPLECDRDTIEPPVGLWVRTLACIAEHRTQTLPPVPEPVILRATPATGRTWWRRADVLVAAGLLLCVSALLPPGINHLRFRSDRLACENNLKQFYLALSGYGDRHGGQLPNVSEVSAPRRVAGMVVPVLMQEMNGKAPALNVACPTQTVRTPRYPPLEQFPAMNKDDFERFADEMLGSYAYTLGYRDGDRYVGHRADAAHLPIMADRPPLGVENGIAGNSPNHGGKGQNVLYGGGNVRFLADRFVGQPQDDIYANERGRVQAGVRANDAVLGASNASPDW